MLATRHVPGTFKRWQTSQLQSTSASNRRPSRCQKLNVANKISRDNLLIQGKTPEVKATESLKNFFTMVAYSVVLNQNMGTRHRTALYPVLLEYVLANPITDGFQFLEKMMAHEDHEMRVAAVRLLEVRKTFGDEDFDFAAMKEKAIEGMKEENVQLRRELLEEQLTCGTGTPGEECEVDTFLEDVEEEEAESGSGSGEKDEADD